MLRRLLTLLLMLCLATGAAARGCPMALAAQAESGASAQASMPDCPHAKAARAALAEVDAAGLESLDKAKTGCDHCKQCRVQVPPVEPPSQRPLLPPTHVPGFDAPMRAAPFSAPNLRPPISNSPAHHA